MLTHRISCRAAGLCVSPTPAVNADSKRIADRIRNDADPIQAFFSALFFVWRPPHPLHPHLLCTRKSEARTDSPGAFVCWSTAPNPKNHAVRRMTADTIGRIIARWPHPARKRHRRKKTGRQAEQGTDNSGTEIHFRFPAGPVHGLALVRNCSLRLENP